MGGLCMRLDYDSRPPKQTAKDSRQNQDHPQTPEQLLSVASLMHRYYLAAKFIRSYFQMVYPLVVERETPLKEQLVQVGTDVGPVRLVDGCVLRFPDLVFRRGRACRPALCGEEEWIPRCAFHCACCLV